MESQQYGVSVELVLPYQSIEGGKSGENTVATQCHAREKVMKSIVKMVQLKCDTSF